MSLADIRELVYTKGLRFARVEGTGGGRSDSSSLVSIEGALEQADQLLEAGRYQSAIDSYHRVRARVYALINGRRGGASHSGALRTPHRVAELEAFLQGSSGILGRLPAMKEVASSIDLGLDDGSVERMASLGVRDASLTSRAAGRAQRGFEALLEGEYEQAVADFQVALEGADSGEAGSIQLNLGTALLQMGDARRAESHFEAASASFERSDDVLGGAQVAQNMAVLLAARGDVNGARRAFEQAEQRAEKGAGGLAQAAKVVRELERQNTDLGPLLDPGRPFLGDRIEIPQPVSPRPPVGPIGGRIDVRSAESIGSLRLGLSAAARQSTGSIADVGAGLGLVIREVGESARFHVSDLSGDFSHGREAKIQGGFLVGGEVQELSWSGVAGPGTAALITRLYEPRIAAKELSALAWRAVTPGETAARLAHIYYFETALALGDAQAGLSNWRSSRRWYLRAADYKFLNEAIEAPLLWQRIAATYLEEGDEHYRDDDLPAAAEVYSKVLSAELSAPVASPLYDHDALRATGELIPSLLDDPNSPDPALGSGTAATVMDVAQRLSQIGAGLDWFGVPAQFLPPFTFAHLQSAARMLANQAKFAERDYIQFMERYDSSSLTKLQLEHAAASASAEADVVEAQRDASLLEVTVAQRALALAQQRATDAQAARNAYANMSSEQISLETNIAWYSTQNTWELENKIPGDGPDGGKHIHEVVSEDRRRLGEISQEYELLRMDQNTQQMQLAASQAQAQVAVAQARAQAANFAVAAANLRATQASELVDAFDASTFTPEVWWRLAHFMKGQASRYLHWATRVARLMERIYEFEQDLQINRIRSDYGVGTVNGLLGADRLLSDVDFFTFHEITETTYRPQKASTRISLAERFPFAFQTELRQTGQMSFEIDLTDVELAHPGSFNQRIQAIEVHAVGVVPRGGLVGSLRNAGFSEYSTRSGERKFRVQDVETLMLSAYTRADSVQFRPRPEHLGVFEGAGLASSWTLEFPPESNDIDFRFLVDVELVVHYEAGFDRQLEQIVRTRELPEAATRASTSLSARWDAPDRFFRLQSEGSTTLTIGPEWLPRQHLDPRVHKISVQLLGKDGPLGAGHPVSLGAPGHDSVQLETDDDGRVASDVAELAAQSGDLLLGDWQLALADDAEARQVVDDVLIFVEYNYTRRGTP